MLKQIILALILVSSIAQAATITGTIYDLDFSKVEEVLVTVNSVPEQKYFSSDGSYKFELPPGEYTIIARQEDLLAEENIEVISEGNYVIDLFLFPSFEEETQLLDEEESVPDVGDGPSSWIWIVPIFILISLIIFYFLRKKPKKEEKEIIKEDLEKLIQIIKKHGGRTTQKELRKELFLSEAKISLMVTELESMNKVKRIKKGRANVIILI
ncbi:MAG: hypothetical protein PHT54_01500 [Candidatus Nanoarchaeia archaeon]|nr:hypothetical protein [Candidatus Nanoarchaeia archaeon]